MTYVNELVQFGQKFYFKIIKDRWIMKKISYERGAYESVDDKSIS